MASIQQRGGRWQLRVVHKLLPKPFFSTFTDEAEAREYASKLESLLERGIVPAELLVAEKRNDNPLLSKIIRDYLADSNIAPSDRPVLMLVDAHEGHTRLLSITAAWADAWAGRLKVDHHLAPSTIRKRVESLARVIDWYWRLKGETIVNPLRSMPRGYASATAAETRKIKAAGFDVRRDAQRDRALSVPEIARIRDALAGAPRPDRQRALAVDADLTLLFELIIATGLRLSEAFTLRIEQIDTVRWVINVDGSKGHRGAIKPRMVPVVKPLRQALQERCRGRVGMLFGFWDGTPEDKRRASIRLSQRFRTLFSYSDVRDCTEHDLRHTATCAWVSMRDASGRWIFSETEICRLMGWTDTRMMLRYASLRGEDLAQRLG